ncbi:protein of unknown function [Desulfotomaculum arcticum]|uniref:Transcobalamin-like C-terminal domain-containing protein n=1 Tax=Desulfotruncus arcticus DSM 17038 TaxID=1121424 RepID=A0A1I2Q7S9_9FIRM|nr:DUF4430 domain-containing protein [Desulfotruncus arcticus]SFG24414.1 protein of unknown function [Desulfotomaculum arcticum] [Desulfotruncus arcticus DSM 17038]
MKRLFLVMLLLTALACAGCGSDALDKNNGEENSPHQNAAVNEDTGLQNVIETENPAENGRQPVKSAEETAQKPGGHQTPPKENSTSRQEPEGAEATFIPNEPSSGPIVSLWVTSDFAGEEIFAREVPRASGESVMSILQDNLQVKTQYGGGFVESINGLASGYTGADKKKKDWFYYMNGIITAVGAMDYRPVSGEIIWWDYHDWGSTVFTPAVIGAFPEPFRSGYRGVNPGTMVLATSGCESLGQQLALYLRNLGAKDIEVNPYDEDLLAENKKITLVVGLWHELEKSPYWQGMQKQRHKTGLFVELASDYFAALSTNGTISRRFNENVGAIIATGTGMGDSSPVWLVTGLDQNGLESAVKILTENTGAVKQHFGALVVDGQVIAVPAN